MWSLRGVKENGINAKSEEKMARNFSNPRKDINPNIQAAQYTSKTEGRKEERKKGRKEEKKEGRQEGRQAGRQAGMEEGKEGGPPSPVTYRHIIIKILQNKDYILRAVRRKMHYLQRNNNKIFADFSREILEGRQNEIIFT